jgi:hypothetical protein
MNYTLYNKQLQRKLVHPIVGLWSTSSLEEAEKMLAACHEYLCAINLADLKDEFVIIDVATEQEIS